MKENDIDTNVQHLNSGTNECLRILEDLLKGLKFGSIVLVVQDGKVVQVEKNEKIRM